MDRPLLVEAVTTPESAREVMARGADGAVVVSDHGGRQLDRIAATLDVLPAIRAAVGQQATVLVDGGIRHGLDVLAAPALGADGVLLARAHLHGHMAGGQDGVVRRGKSSTACTGAAGSFSASGAAKTSPIATWGSGRRRRTRRLATRASSGIERSRAAPHRHAARRRPGRDRPPYLRRRRSCGAAARAETDHPDPAGAVGPVRQPATHCPDVVGDRSVAAPGLPDHAAHAGRAAVAAEEIRPTAR